MADPGTTRARYSPTSGRWTDDHSCRHSGEFLNGATSAAPTAS